MSDDTVYKICPNCFRARPYDKGCLTPACQVLQSSPAYLREEIELRLNAARMMLALGNTLQDWDKVVRLLELEHAQYSANKGAEAFTQ